MIRAIDVRRARAMSAPAKASSAYPLFQNVMSNLTCSRFASFEMMPSPGLEAEHRTRGLAIRR